MEGRTSKNFTAMNDEVDAILDEYNFGGVILFAENVSGTEQTARLTEELQTSALQDATGDQNKIRCSSELTKKVVLSTELVPVQHFLAIWP